MVPGQRRASHGPPRGGRGDRGLRHVPGPRPVPGDVVASLGHRPARHLGRPGSRRPRPAASPAHRARLAPRDGCCRERGHGCHVACAVARGGRRGRPMSAETLHHGPVPAGRLRIYLGYASGVGTTCALLSEGHRRAERGADVVVASACAHGRAYAAGLLAGLEVISAVTIPHEGTAVAEMDLGAGLARSPAVALVDDLAHHNVPGARHARRWQAVEDLLQAGIDVVSTVSLQHLESLADLVEQVTGLWPAETMPDSVVAAADEVELVDVAPETLRDRMAGGYIYQAEQAERALDG